MRMVVLPFFLLAFGAFLLGATFFAGFPALTAAKLSFNDPWPASITVAFPLTLIFAGLCWFSLSPAFNALMFSARLVVAPAAPVSDAHAIDVVVELLASGRTGIVSERVEHRHYPSAVCPLQRVELPHDPAAAQPNLKAGLLVGAHTRPS